MNLSIGNLVRKETSISVMLQGSYMLFQKIWLLIFQSTSKFPGLIAKESSYCFCPKVIYPDLFSWNGNHLGMCYTSMLMRMFPWVHGSLDWMQSILMTEDYVAVHHLVIS